VAFFGIIFVFAKALCAKRQMNVDLMFTALNFRLVDGDIIIKNKNTNIVSDDKPRVVWHSMKTVANFMSYLTTFILTYVQHRHFS
jgi:hypothetical protein